MLPVMDDDLGPVNAVVILFKRLLPGRLEVLDGGLGVELTGQDVEHLWVVPA